MLLQHPLSFSLCKEFEPTLRLDRRLGLSGVRTKEESVEDFIQAIGAIPDDLSFEERLLSFNVVDASGMTLVFTPYEFYVDGRFSHCGTNVFTLVEKESKWKILALYDTRNKSCEFSNQTN